MEVQEAKGCLAEWLRHSSGTPQVLSSNPNGSEFQAVVKKTPSLVPCAKALVVRPVRPAATEVWATNDPAYGQRKSPARHRPR
jgi:hypothetical protein